MQFLFVNYALTDLEAQSQRGGLSKVLKIIKMYTLNLHNFCQIYFNKHFFSVKKKDDSSPEVDLYIHYNPSHNTSQFWVEIDKQVVKHIWKCEGLGIAKASLEKKNHVGGLIPLPCIST